jgi:hypothetical protein
MKQSSHGCLLWHLEEKEETKVVFETPGEGFEPSGPL